MPGFQHLCWSREIRGLLPFEVLPINKVKTDLKRRSHLTCIECLEEFSCTTWRLSSVSWYPFIRDGLKAGVKVYKLTCSLLLPIAFMRLVVKDGCLKFSGPSAGFRNTSSIILSTIGLDFGPLVACWRNLGTWSEILGILFSWAACDESIEISQSNYGSDKAHTAKAKMINIPFASVSANQNCNPWQLKTVDNRFICNQVKR